MTTTAPEILRKLEQPGALDSTVLEEAASFFAARGDAGRARWLDCERQGFPAATSALDLPILLGPLAAPPVVEAVIRARLRRGRVVVGQPGRVVEWPHFFIEGVDELRSLRDRLSPAGAGRVVVDFEEAGDSLAPRSLSFAPEVFDDLLDGIALEVADAVRRAAS